MNVGKYQEFILTLLKEVMIPATWLSVDEIYGRLNELHTRTNKKYVQLPTKHSLAQQMCRFYTGSIKVKKFGTRNLYCLMIDDEDDIKKVIEIRANHQLDPTSWPEDWTEMFLDEYREGINDWLRYQIEKQTEPEEDEFEL